MYIDKIDELLDKTIDDYYETLMNNQKIQSIFGDINFVRHQKEINNIFDLHMNSINMEEIRNIIKNNDNVDMVIQIIKRYIAYYTFLMIAFFYKHDKKTFINNIVEFSKNQGLYTYKISNFFNSGNNAKIIEFYQMIRDILIIINVINKENSDKSTLNNLKAKKNMKSAFDFIDSLGKDYVKQVFSASSYDTPKEQAHNIIKTLIILEIYKKIDKQEIYRLIELVEQEKGEYIFIDIVVPKKQNVDYSTIEDILSSEEIESGYAHELWNYIIEQDQIKHFDNVDAKILKLINSKLMIPITQEFLLYHHSSEKYEQHNSSNKKQDTKIKYIINKIDLASELFSPQKDPTNILKIKKSFSPLLNEKRAVTINDGEDQRIIAKNLNFSQQSSTNFDYHLDLLSHRTNPYVNFKDFKNYGFSITFNKSTDCIRSIVFDKTGEFKQNHNNVVQMRSGPRNIHTDIVGFLMPSNISSIECTKIKKLTDIRNITNNKNGYALMKQLLIDTKLQNVKHGSSVFWLFDLNKDNVKIKSYDQTNKLTERDQIKHMVGQLYDDIQFYAFNAIKYDMQKLQKNLTLDDIKKIIEHYQIKYIDIQNNDEYMDELENLSYELMIKSESKYDENDDIFFGLSGDIIKLPSIISHDRSKIESVKIEVAKYEHHIHQEVINTHSAICQHHIEWNNLAQIRKKDPNKHADGIYKFMSNYVIENAEQEYVCKSCGTYVNINKYISDGKFDSATGQFITYSIPIFTPLEEMAEYLKYNLAIRGIDKIIDRFASIINIPFLIGTVRDIKQNRKPIIKNVIDLILLNNSFLRKNITKRNPEAIKLYGINEKLTSIFSFHLDNAIFVYSSKEKDLYKIPKYNNVMTYIYIMITLELNVDNILSLSKNKKNSCSYEIFAKYGKNLFDGLKIRKNTDGDLVHINKYPSFCYVIFIMSCMSSLYNMWLYADNVSPQARKKNHLTVQKIIIHSFVDILNSLLENSTLHSSNKIYKIFSTKFYDKLSSVYSDPTIIKRLDESIEQIEDMQKSSSDTKIKSIKPTGTYEKMLLDESIYRDNPPATYFAPLRVDDTIKIKTMNNVTNCKNGNFHRWVPKNNSYMCKICDSDIYDTHYDPKLTEDIYKNYKYIKLQKLANTFCENGKMHKIICKNSNASICDKCNETNNANKSFTHDELDFFNSKIIKLHNKQNKMDINKNNSIQNAEKKESEYVLSVIEKLTSQYSTNNEQKFKFIVDFIHTVQSVVGSSISIGNDNVDLLNNIYIIKYDHMGNAIDKIELSESDNKVTLKKNHPIFNTDVLMYIDTRTTKVEVYYDAITNTLLGYKEQNSKLVHNNDANIKLTVKYSILNKLKYLGHNEIYVKLSDKLNNKNNDNQSQSQSQSDSYNDDTYDDFTRIVNDIMIHRNKNLKKVMYNFKRSINRIKYNFADANDTNSNINNDDNYTNTNDTLTQITEIYKQKISKIKLYDANNTHKIFKHWKAINLGVNPKLLHKNTMNVHDDTKILYADTLNQHDVNNNLILFYITYNMKKLIEYNDNKFIKMNIITFLIEFINATFDMFNVEYMHNNIEIKRFKYIIEGDGFIHDDEQKGYGLDMYGNDDDVEISDEQQNNIDDINEEMDAMDVDIDDLDSANEHFMERQ